MAPAPSPNKSAPRPIRIQLRPGSVQWPDFCPCCGGTADGRLPDRHPAITGRPSPPGYRPTWTAPYCSDCLSHALRYAQAKWLSRQGRRAVATTWAIGLVLLPIIWFIGIRFFEERLGSLAARALVGLLGALDIGLTFKFASHVREQVRIDTLRMRERAGKFQSPACCTPYVAVVPQPSEEGSPTFELYNARFAAAFTRMNGARRLPG